MAEQPLFHAVHHVGVSVADLERSIGFWEGMLGASARDRRVLEGPRLGDLVGYAGPRIDSCWFDLPGGVSLELLDYLEPEATPYEPGTAHPGNVHVCLLVDDASTACEHAVGCGARLVGDAPIEVTRGPKAGSRVAYVTDPDGVTIELYEPPPQGDG